MSAAKVQLPVLNNINDRIHSLNWPEIHASLHKFGWARTGEILTPEECGALRDLYADENRFRSKIVMARHRFGLGEYKYFAYPLPEDVVDLRESLYSHLVEVANEWARQLGLGINYPETHREFVRQCHQKGQKRPTPLLLRYERNGYNCLHQDLYGEIYFPLQTVFLLDQPERDFEGGEFVLVEQRPRAQSSAQVIAPRQGEAVIFTTRWRPVSGTRGHYRVNIKHGVSTVTRGQRHTLGIVYHDAE
ncbi:MAG TPA: 2OG-Fe(II) oxygenase [Candidatus Sulfotelmatobacter sp.]|nr:2OG-Fe(II) oxygenase [Candidatus Sulfotelmatobacter sp.]